MFSWRFLIGLILLTATLAILEWQVGWDHVLQAWKALPMHILLLALSGVLLSFFCKAGRMAHAWREHTQGRHLAVARISQLHNLAVVFVPMRAGEAVFPLMMKRRFGLGLVETGASLAWFRLLDLTLLVSVALGVYLATRNPLWLLAFMALMSVVTAWFPTLIRWFFRQLPAQGRLGELTARIQRGIPRRRRDFWFSWTWSLGIWGFKFPALILLYMGFADI